MAAPDNKLLVAALAGAAVGCLATLALSRKQESQQPRNTSSQQDAVTHCNSGWTTPNIEKAGVADHVELIATLPYTVQPNAEDDSDLLLTSCCLYHAPSITAMVHDILKSREVAGLPGVFFADIVDIVLNKGASRVYASGGFVRDAFCGVVSDDMDFLLRSKGGSLVPFLESVALSRNWPVYRKSDEKTGQARWDFIAIGDKDAKAKWSAHPCGSGCEGDFCCNSMLFDIKCGALIDPTGYGIQDSVNFILRHNRSSFEEWAAEDRLAGMKLVRYFNFCGRGYAPSSIEFRKQVVTEALRVLPTDEGKVTLDVFFKRKVFRDTADKSIAKELTFRAAVVDEITKSRVMSSVEACAWYLKVVAPLYGKHIAKFPGLDATLMAKMTQHAAALGLKETFDKPW